MVKKANRAEAEAWRREINEAAKRETDLSDQKEALFYAANKRSNTCYFPCADTLDKLGHHEAAAKVRQAYRLLEDAEYTFNKQERPEDYA